MTTTDKASVVAEIRGVDGTLYRVECPEKDLDTIRSVFQSSVIDITTELNKKTKLEHGGYSVISRYDIESLGYLGGETGYLEFLHVKDAPPGYAPFVIHQFDGYSGSRLVEVESRELLKSAAERGLFQPPEIRDITIHYCGPFSPWFYAVGDQPILGRVVAPEHKVVSVPGYVQGRKFIIKDRYLGETTVKTFVAAVKPDDESDDVVLLWDDGTHFSLCNHSSEYVRPVTADVAWIDAAVVQFRSLLVGNIKSFSIPFFSGGELKCKYVPPKKGPVKQDAGSYHLKIIVEKDGKEEMKDGNVDYDPKENGPSVEAMVEEQAKKAGFKLLKIDHCYKIVRRTKGWTGVYEDPYKETTNS